MGFEYTLQKVLDYKERQKQEKEALFNQAVRAFEEVATALYHLLKKKEDTEKFHEEKLQHGVTVSELQMQQSQLLRLQKEIEKQQRMTNLARENMNRAQQHLLEMSIEHKKYVKMKEKQMEQYLANLKSEETKLMDEISIQMYANR